MKHTSLLTIALFFSFFYTAEAQQTLVNLSRIDTLGVPATMFSYNKGIHLSTGGFALLDNNYLSGVNQDAYHVIFYDSVGDQLSQVNYSGMNGGMNLGTNIFSKGNYAYVIGVTANAAADSFTRCHILKINIHTLDTAWTTSVTIDSTVTQAPFAVMVDDTGNVFMGIAVQAHDAFRAVVVKFDSSGHELWEAGYDSIGWGVTPVAMAISGPTLLVTGFMFDSIGHSYFLVYGINRNTGAQDPPKFTANGTGVISHPVGIMNDLSGNCYISGTSTVAGNTSIIKTEAFDSAFNLLWSASYGDSTMANTASAMVQNAPGLNAVIVIGSITDSTGISGIILLVYGLDGTFGGSLTIPNPYPGQSYGGTSITQDGPGNTYLTGWAFDGTDTVVLTAAISTSITLLWEKTYHRARGTNDLPYSVIVGSDNQILVTTRSYGTDSVYEMLTYKQDKTNTAPDSTVPLQQWAYYENKGQIIDSGTHQASYVHYYTNTSNPRLYITDDALSYVYAVIDSTTDTLQRIDLKLEKTETGNPVNTSPDYYSSEQIAPFLNYYIGGLPQYYEHVNGYQRVTAKNVYPNIDWQLYSDSGGLKYYYVINPGGTPDDIQFRYTGADSIRYDTTGMRIYSRYGVASQQPFTAWQYSGGTATQVSLTLSGYGSTHFSFTTGSYDNTQPLYIVMEQKAPRDIWPNWDVLKWCTYWGGSGIDEGTAVTTDEYNNQYVAGYTASTDFPVSTGLTTNSQGNKGSFVTKFDQNNLMFWSTFYGTTSVQVYGFANHYTTAIAYYDWGVYITGKTNFTNLPMQNGGTGALFQSSSFGGGNNYDIFLARFQPGGGALSHSTYIGSTDGDDEATAMAVDPVTSCMTLVGCTKGTDFNYTNSTLSGNFYASSGTGIIMEFDKYAALLVASGFGSSTISGTGACTYISDVKVDKDNALIITGSTPYDFPSGSPYSLASWPTGAYRQTYPGGAASCAFVAKFSASEFIDTKYQLFYYSLFGGSNATFGEKICSNSAADIYMVGHSDCSSFPKYPSTLTCPSPATDMFIAKFDHNGVQTYANLIPGSGPVVLGQTPYDTYNHGLITNGNGDARREGDILCDASDNLYIYALAAPSSFSMTFPTPRLGAYFDNTNAGQKCVILEYENTTTPTLTWGTFFGGATGLAGMGIQYAGGMARDNNNNLYICGGTDVYGTDTYGNQYFPLMNETGATNNWTFNNGFNSSGFQWEDAFVAKFDLFSLLLGVNNISGVNSLLTCYPNPSAGAFIVNMAKFAPGMKEIKIYDEVGRIVYSSQTVEDQIQINMPHIIGGLYIVEVTEGSERDVAKIIITNN